MHCQVIGPGPLLYVSVREFGVTHPHDNKISVLGTDDVTTNLVLLVRHSGSCAVGLTQVPVFFPRLVLNLRPKYNFVKHRQFLCMFKIIC
jgi:hypothetical protein